MRGIISGITIHCTPHSLVLAKRISAKGIVCCYSSNLQNISRNFYIVTQVQTTHQPFTVTFDLLLTKEPALYLDLTLIRIFHKKAMIAEGSYNITRIYDKHQYEHPFQVGHTANSLGLHR